MKTLLAIIICLSATFTFCQENKLKWGFQLFPNFSTGIPKKDGVQAEYYNGVETSVFTYSAGFELDWNFAEKWTLSTGILYKEVGERGKVIPADPMRGFIYSEQFRFKLCYLELPINLNRNLGKNWLLEFGISPMITICAKYGTDRYYNLNLSNEFRKPTGLHANLGFGFRTAVGSFNLKIIPYAQMGVFIGTKAAYYLWPDMRYFSGGIKIAVLI